MSTFSPGPLIARGRTAEVFAWQNGQVIKLFYNWVDSSTIAKEFSTGQIISSYPLPTPKMIAQVTIGERTGITYERVDGPTLLTRVNAKPWDAKKAARTLADLHWSIHQQTAEPFPSLYKSLVQTIERLDQLPAETKKQVQNVLQHLPEGKTLCHCDFHPDQVILSPRGPMIIDWVNALRGDPAADVARTCLLLNIGQLPYGGWLMKAMINSWRSLFLRVYLGHYLKLNPSIDRKQIDTWMIPVAAARLEENIPGEKENLLKIIQKQLQEVV